MVLWGCPPPRRYLSVSPVPPEEHGIKGPVPQPPGGPLVGPAQPPVHLPHQGEGLLPQRVRDRAPVPVPGLGPLCPSRWLPPAAPVPAAIGCRDNPQSMSVILSSSACMPSWVMARRKSLSICMLPWVMARLCARDWVLVRSGSPSWAMDWLGYLSSAMDWLGSLSWGRMGEGLSLRAWNGTGPSLSRPGLGCDHLPFRRDYIFLG